MVKLEHDMNMQVQAKRLADRLGSLNNSVTKGRGNAVGYFGEQAVARYLGATVMSSDLGVAKYNHDLMIGDLRIEVKTKRRTVDPRKGFEVSLSDTSMHQSPDFFAFVSVTFGRKVGKGLTAVYYDPKTVWLCGMYPAERYKRDARFIPSGTQDGSNGFVSHGSIYNMFIGNLMTWEECKAFYSERAAETVK